MRAALRVLTVAAVLMLAVGGSASAASTPTLPDTILGLKVAREDVSKTITEDHRALYVDDISLYSLREPTSLLEATLQLGRFKKDAPWTSNDFQLSMVGQLGTSVPIVVRAASQRVYITTTKGLTIAVWFRNAHLFVLSIRTAYKHPKELLRQALGVRP